MGRSLLVVMSSFVFLVAGCNSSGVLGESDPATPTPVPTEPPEGDVVFPQAVGGAMWANPDLYATIPLRVYVNAAIDASDVDVVVDGVAIDADGEGGGDFVAHVAIGDLLDGAHAVEALVEADGETYSATAELWTGRAGVQLTEYAIDGPANTPRVHRAGDAALVTWSDRSEGAAIAWARTLDGAGRWSAERVPLVTSALDTTAVRTAVGAGAIGVLRQDLDPGPYVSRFSVTDLAGNELVPAIDLVEDGTYGSWGGDVAWDGSAFVLVWRVNDGAGSSVVRWARVDPSAGLVAGPVTVASPGNGAPHGAFSPQTVVGVRALGGKSLVSFTREWWDMTKSEFVWVDADGTLGPLQMAGTDTDTRYHWEARVHALGAGALAATWVATPLGDEPNPPATIFTSIAGTAGATLASGKASITSPAMVSEPVLLGHPTQNAIAIWSDERSYVTSPPASAQIELWFATLDAEMESGEAARIAHSRLFASSSEVQAVPAGTNVLLVWRDERTMLYEPELWFETLWY